MIRGNTHQVRIKIDDKLRFPGKSESERQQLDNIIREAGKWTEVSQLDTVSLTRIVEAGLWDKKLIDEVMKFGRIEESNSIYLSRLKDEEK